MDKVLADPYLRELYEDGKAGFRINIDFANDVLFMNYQCRSDTVLNCAIVHHTRKDQDESDVWNSRASVAQTLEICQNFHPVLKRYIELCEEEDIKVHHSMKRLPLPSFVSGRALVLGDAAHVMLPTHAAGLTVAVESAAALEPIMSGIRSGEEHSVKERLGLWNNLRNGRCNFVMLMSNAGPGGLNLPGVEDEIRKYYGGRLPPKEAMLWTEKSREVFFDCDAVAEAKTAMLNAGFMLD
jgi:salicylate hydroxylase